MPIHIRYFASLRERMGRAGDTLDADVTSVAQAWTRAAGNRPLPQNTLVAINRQYAGLDDVVRDGDEVAFFPPVTGG